MLLIAVSLLSLPDILLDNSLSVESPEVEGGIHAHPHRLDSRGIHHTGLLPELSVSQTRMGRGLGPWVGHQTNILKSIAITQLTIPSS